MTAQMQTIFTADGTDANVCAATYDFCDTGVDIVVFPYDVG